MVFVERLAGRQRRAAADWLRIRGAIWYVRGVGKARGAAVALAVAAGCLLLGAAGFLLLHVGLFLWLPVAPPVKGLILAGLGLAYLFVAMLVLRNSLSERTWLRASGADELIARVTRRGERDRLF